jgi:EmrB/QacA subfamily drug resistance transporter
MPGAAGSRSWRPVALLVAGAFFMENLDGTVVATAAPRMAQSFSVRPVDINIVITAYLLTLGVLIPVSGWIADRFGARRVFALAVAIFTVASGLCAISTSLGELTAVRVLQGVGGAMMVPVGRLVVLRGTDRSEIVNAMAYLTWPALAAPVLAPAIGGVLTTYASWRWIFVINLPLGVAAALVAIKIVPDTRQLGRLPLDVLGFVLTAVGLTALVVGLEQATETHVDWLFFAMATGGGVVALVLSVFELRRSSNPLVELGDLSISTFRAAMLGGSFFRLAIGAAPFLLPLMFQAEFGWSPLKSGLLVIAVFVGNIGIKPLTTPMLRIFGFKKVLLLATIVGAITLVLCGLLTSGTPLPVIAVVLFASGVFRSIGFTAYNSIAFADISPANLSSANTFAATATQLTMGLGVAAGALGLRAGGPVSRAFGFSSAGHGPYAVAFFLMAALAFVGAAESTRLPSDAGSAIAPRRP